MFYGKVWAILIVFIAYLLQDSESHLFHHDGKTTPLKCWKCASDASQLESEFCGRNIDDRNLSDEDKLASYVECNSEHNFVPFNPKGDEIVHKCEVYKQIVNYFQEVFVRGCTLELKNASEDRCLSKYSFRDTAYVKTVECKTCTSSDLCNQMLDNSSIGVKMSKVAVVSAIVLIVLLV